MISKIHTKEESKNFIISHGLNHVPEIFLLPEDDASAKLFFQENPAELYVIRSADHSSANYEYIGNFKEYQQARRNFSGRIILAVSVNSFQNKILLGAIEILEHTVRFCATENKALDHRTMYNGAEYNFETDIFDKKLNRIPEFDYLYQYLSDHDLFGYTVEFTIYDRPVGTNQERILINEVRNY